VWEKSFVDPESLSFAEMRTLEASYWGAISRWLSQYRLYKRGLLDADDWKSTVFTDAPALLQNRYGLAWWEEMRKSPTIPEELKLEVDRMLADESRAGLYELYQRIRANLKM
jgi:hypothetical protein